MIKRIEIDQRNDMALESLNVKVHTDFSLTNTDLTPLRKLKTLQLVTDFGQNMEVLDLKMLEGMKKLERLRISNLKIGEILKADSGCVLSQLEDLELTSNNLAEIDLDIISCSTELEELSLAKNLLTSFGDDDSCMWPKLKVLNLKENKLTKFNSKKLSCASKLRKINLSGNELATFDPIDAASGLCITPKMEEIILNKNKLTSVNLEQFKCAKSLSIIDLRENQLMTLETDINKSIFPRLKEFYIVQNKWSCSELTVLMDNLSKGKIAHYPAVALEESCAVKGIDGVCCY